MTDRKFVMDRLSVILSIIVIHGSSSFTSSINYHKSKSFIISNWCENEINEFRHGRQCENWMSSSSDEEENHGSEEGPLAKGLDSVSWLPSVGNVKKEVTSVREGTEILPLFPLGGIVYTPNTKHILNIFEPRYREMYNDILMNGSKRFVVSMSHPEKSGTFAQMGVLFELEDLKEVSEQTNDQVKYICNHRVIGRVHMHQILNPHVWSTRESYLKVEATVIREDGQEGNSSQQQPAQEKKSSGGGLVGDIYSTLMSKFSDAAPKEEKDLTKSFSILVTLQHELQEDVRFTRASIKSLSVSAGNSEDNSLWSTIRLWQSYIEQRLVARQNELQREFQDKLLQFLTKEKGIKEEELPSAIGFMDLSPALQNEVKELQKRMAVELKPLVLESTLAMQKILEASSHKERLILLRYFVDAERKRLEAKKTLQGVFTTTAAEDNTYTTPVKEDDQPKSSSAPSLKGETPNNGGSTFFDEPDAFQ